jgi:tRNA pseudouridine13 synthase
MTNDATTDRQGLRKTAGRYLTDDLPGIGGVIKDRPEDFLVEEIPLYPPSGDGGHTFFKVRKTGISTFRAIDMIARALGTHPRRVGYAGLKDAQATTWQVLSVEGIPPDSVTALDLPGLSIVWAKRHPRKLKIGHLEGNRFTIRVRGVSKAALEPCHQIVEVLALRGVPNRFGAQRFGLHGISGQLGRAQVLRDWELFVKLFLGTPHSSEVEPVRLARSHFDSGRWAEAFDLLPHSMTSERAALRTMIATQGDCRRAYSSLPKRLKLFLLSAYQSALFNKVLAVRLQSIDRVFAGDVAVKHPGRSMFRVQDEEAEQVRTSRLEISPTGPMFGYKMMQASGQQGELESSILKEEGISLEDFGGDGISARGERRALRFVIRQPQVWYDDGLVLRFELGRGCYATTVLDEIQKTEPGEGDPIM